jgi:hypothetical protein
VSAAAALDRGEWPVPVGSPRAAAIIAAVREDLKRPDRSYSITGDGPPKRKPGRPRTCECGTCAKCRRRVKRGLPPGDPRHGSRNGYVNYGCRCPECRAANRAKERERIAKRRAA